MYGGRLMEEGRGWVVKGWGMGKEVWGNGLEEELRVG